MSNSETIKEFLVALGFKVDEQSFKKFDEATGLATKNVASLGLIVLSTAAAVETFVAKVAGSLDKLYFASKRTGSSAGDIGAFDYAIEQMGGTAEDAQASLENLARFMRTQPGAGGILQAMFGVKPEHLGDAAKEMNDIAGTFQRMARSGQQPLVYRLAAMLGIDEKTMLAMQETGQFNAKQEEYNELLKKSGIDLQDLTKQGMEFDKQLKTLETSFGLLGDKIAGYLIPVVEKLNQAILGLTGASTGTTLGVMAGVGAVAATGLKGVPIIGGMAGLLSRLGIVGAMASIPWVAGDIGSAIGTWIKGKEESTNTSDPAKQAMDFFKKAGWTTAQAAGLTANIARESNFDPNAVGDSGKARGIAQWHPDRQEAFAQWSGHDIQTATLGEQLAFMNHELTQGAYSKAGAALGVTNDPASAAAIVAQLYEKPSNIFGESALRGNLAQQYYNQASSGGAATVNQTTTITVQGANDPQTTASSVVNAQNQVNQQLVRNVAGAVQ